MQQVENEKSTLVPPALCFQMNEPDVLIKSGFVRGYSAINYPEVISLQIPGKADTRVKNNENTTMENKPDRATEMRQSGCESRKDGSLDTLVSCRVREENSNQAVPMALESRPSPAFHGHLGSAHAGARILILSRLTLTTASRGHAVPAITVFTPEGPHGVDAVSLPTDVRPQALVHVYMKQKTLSRFNF